MKNCAGDYSRLIGVEFEGLIEVLDTAVVPAFVRISFAAIAESASMQRSPGECPFGICTAVCGHDGRLPPSL
jgi:hypothetical protein